MAVLLIAEKRFQDQYPSFNSEGGKMYKCTPAESKDAVTRYRVHLIILDCGFEVGNGLKLLQELKSFQPRTPVIFITDVGSEEIVLKAFKAGARDVLKKPVNMPELQDTVKGLLAVKKMSRETRRPFIKESTSAPGQFGSEMKSRYAIDFRDTIRYIEENLSDAIGLGAIAEKANMSKYHFCRVFKSRMGMSPLKFVTFMRIEKSKELLQKDGMNISMTAAEVGFKDLSSFIKQFKRLTGLTPSMYRKSLR